MIKFRASGNIADDAAPTITFTSFASEVNTIGLQHLIIAHALARAPAHEIIPRILKYILPEKNVDVMQQRTGIQ